jgi:pyrroloquinoline quinone biosynthesis protein D
VIPEGPLRLARRARLRWDPVREKPMLLVPEGVLVLNRTGHEIVRRIDGTRTAATLAAELAAEFREPRVEGEVLAFLTRLAGKGLIEGTVGGRTNEEASRLGGAGRPGQPEES